MQINLSREIITVVSEILESMDYDELNAVISGPSRNVSVDGVDARNLFAGLLEGTPLKDLTHFNNHQNL
jgi:hypothetical protein